MSVSRIPPQVFETYDKIRSNGSFKLKKTYLNELASLLRPQLIIDDKNFLESFSLQAQKLCTADILEKCMMNCNPVDVPHVNTLAKHPSCSIHLSKTELISQSRQLEMLMRLYDREIEWLSCGSRQWFGQLISGKVTVFIDLSSEASCKDVHTDLVEALKLFFCEQISLCDLANIFVFGSRIVNMNSAHFCSYLTEVQPLGTCDLLGCLQYVADNCHLHEKDHTLLFIICSKPDQSVQVLHDFMIQIFSGMDSCLHFVSIDTDSDIQILLKNITSQFSGHYHEYNSNGSNCMWDSVVQDILDEKQRAQNCHLTIKNILSGETDESLFDCLRQLSIALELSLCCSPPRSLHSIPCSSKNWLKAYGVEACGLNLYHVVAADTFDQLSKYVKVIDRTALSTVYEVMPKFLWKDGTMKYLHVDVKKLQKYEADLNVHNSLLQLRLAWLQSGSRVIFGNLAEERVVIILDCSFESAFHSDELKHHMKMLLQEQVSTKQFFNLIRYSGQKIEEWKSSMCCTNLDCLTDAWRWIREIRPHGNNDLLNCLLYTLKKYGVSGNSSDTSPIGIYIILLSVPDQDVECINSYIEQILCGGSTRLHVILYQPKIPKAEIKSTETTGKYAENLDLYTYTMWLSNSKMNGSHHEYINGKFLGSTDYSLLIEEVSKNRIFYEKNKNILACYKAHCKQV